VPRAFLELNKDGGAFRRCCFWTIVTPTSTRSSTDADTHFDAKYRYVHVVLRVRRAHGAFRHKRDAHRVDAYWLIDGQSMANARLRGKDDDRVELNLIERRLVYGITCSAAEDGGDVRRWCLGHCRG
jgi:hypothetical protein